MEDRIRAVLFLPNLEIGGAENLVLNLAAEYLNSKDFVFHLVTLGRGGKLAARARGMESRGGFVFAELGLPLRHGWKAALALNRYLRLHGIRLVHSHLYVCDNTCLYLKLINPGLKIVSTKHSTIPHGPKMAIANFLSQYLFSRIVFIIPFQRELYRKTCLIFRKTVLIENGSPIPESPAIPAPEAGALRGEEVPRLVCIGSFRPEKGQDILAAALNLVGRTGARFRCDFFGDGPQMESTKASLDAGLDVAFHPARPGLAAELGRYDLVVIPSRREGSPLILLESFLARVPVIASDYPTLAEKAGGGRRATLFKSQDASDLAEKIGAFLGNPGGRTRLVEAAYRYALDFSIAKTAAAYLDLYREVMGNPSEGRNRAGISSMNTVEHD